MTFHHEERFDLTAADIEAAALAALRVKSYVRRGRHGQVRVREYERAGVSPAVSKDWSSALPPMSPDRRLAFAYEVARKLGWRSPSGTSQLPSIAIRLAEWNERHDFDLGDQRHTAAAIFDPAGGGLITLYDAVWRHPTLAAAALIAHELQHATWRRFLERTLEEENSLVADRDAFKNYLSEQHKPMIGEYRKRWPALTLLDEIEDAKGPKLAALRKADGITPYSTEWWKNESGRTRSAINETLAEVAHLVVLGRRKSVPKVWLDLHDTIRKLTGMRRHAEKFPYKEPNAWRTGAKAQRAATSQGEIDYVGYIGPGWTAGTPESYEWAKVVYKNGAVVFARRVV